MTKILKFEKPKSKDERTIKISREMITQFGEYIYSSEEVKEVRMGVVFKDNSAISFKRTEEDDTMEKVTGDIDDE